ncbi:hypothetical protein CDD83_1039 [Cordyceps sp. RAO-2017]|nr:hypothetical protein CDD83_1039 [Cordyceps sp. RAO-2017]
MADESFGEAIRILNSLQSNATARKSAASADASWRRAKFDLTVETLVQLGYPPSHLNKLNIIHIAGSKGKGSTAAMTASILSRFLGSRAPSKIGVFTSPHLRTVRERIRLISGPVTDGSACLISEQQFAAYFFDVWRRLERQHAAGALAELPTFFKCLFAVAVHAFVREGVDTAIVECGIGGEYDATNVLDRPVVSAITTLELEHTDLLGRTLTSVAWHKAGILRAGVPALT